MSAPVESVARRGHGPHGVILLGVFVGLGVAIGLAGAAYLSQQRANAWRLAEQQMSVVADLKVRQIQRWYQENLADAGHIMDSGFAGRAAREFLTAGKRPDSKAEVQRKVESLHKHFDYERVVLLDTNLAVRLAVPAAEAWVGPLARQRATEALRERRIIISDLHRSSESGKINMDLLVPLRDSGEAPVGLLMIELHPDRYLYPLLQSWPSPSRTAETLLVRREGDQVLFLNELRHRTNAALNLRRPLASDMTPASRAARGELGVVRAGDYRGVPVLAASRAIPGTPWFMVAKVDEAEIDAPLREQERAVAVVMGALLLVAGLGVALTWRHLRTRQLQRELRLEREGQSAARRLAAVMQQANDIIILADREGRILEANERAVQGYGYSLAELRAMNVVALRSPETRPDSSRFLEQLRSEQHVVAEAVHVRKDGSPFPVEVSARLVEIAGDTWTLAITRDITERKRTEAAQARLLRILESSLNEIYVFDAETLRFEYVNRGALLNLGYTIEVLRQMTPVDLKPEFTEASFREAIAPLLHHEKDQLLFNTVHRRADGSVYPVEVHLQLVEVQGQRVFLAVILDISERQRHEQERERLVRELARKNEELENLLYAASHDLRSPLVNIEGFSQRLDRALRELAPLATDSSVPDGIRTRATELFDNQFPKSLRYIRSGVTTMNRLLSGLLQLSRLGRDAMTLERLEMDALVRQNLDAMRFQLQRAGADVAVNPLPPCLGDARLVSQVFANLLDNAVKYRDSARPLQITLSGQVVGAEAVYCVADTGIGIAPDHQEKIWELFHRLRPEGAVPGEGLGLNLVRRMMSRLSGRVWVESTPGAGSRFYVALPKAEPAPTITHEHANTAN